METQDGAELCFPQLFNTSCKKPSSSTTQAIILYTVMSCFSLPTVALNLLVIISVSHFRRLHTSTNILLLSLAVSDFLVGILIWLGEVFMRTNCWFLGNLTCVILNFMSFIMISSSVGNMVLISIDRYVAICDPLHYPTRITVSRVKLCVCMCWFCSILYNCLVVMENLTHPGSYNSCHGECVIVINYISGVVDLVLTFILPVTVIIVLYMRVFVVAVSQARAMRSHITGVTLQLSATLTTKKSELKAARTLGVLVVVFLICFCPYFIFFVAGDDSYSSSAELFVLSMLFLNSCLNPVIYALFYPWFRKAIKLIVTGQILQRGSFEANIL